MANFLRRILLPLSFISCLCACAPRESQPWRGILAQYASDESVRELLLVESLGGSEATVRYYTRSGSEAGLTGQAAARLPGGDDSEAATRQEVPGRTGKPVRHLIRCRRVWNLDTEGSAFIGKNGLGNTSEGDAKTPEGDFGVLTAFGILPDPGTALPWLPVGESTFACDEEGPWYNRIIDTVATHHPCKGEDMFHTAPEYNYGLALDFNPDCRYPDGSAIFFHCKGHKAYTGGCIAVDEAFMRHILTSAHPGLRVIIH